MAVESNSSRREFLVRSVPAFAVAGSLRGGDGGHGTSAAPLKIVDFHNHPSAILDHDQPRQRAARGAAGRRGIEQESAEPGRAAGVVETAGIAARVINTPTAFIEDADGKVPHGTIERINDRMAELVAKHPGKLYGLATVDAFSGDDGAREVTRAGQGPQAARPVP